MNGASYLSSIGPPRVERSCSVLRVGKSWSRIRVSDEVERCTQAIVNFPEAGLLITKTIRRRLLPRFSYALLYSIKPDRVRVLAVMNLKRRPMYWVGRE